MIERVWRGITSSENSDNYIAHLENDTFPKLKTLTGHIGSTILKRTLDEGTIEFLIMTRWESIEVIRDFAGNNIDIAVIPEVADSLLLSYEKFVTHYQVYA